MSDMPGGRVGTGERAGRGRHGRKKHTRAEGGRGRERKEGRHGSQAGRQGSIDLTRPVSGSVAQPDRLLLLSSTTSVSPPTMQHVPSTHKLTTLSLSPQNETPFNNKVTFTLPTIQIRPKYWVPNLQFTYGFFWTPSVAKRSIFPNFERAKTSPCWTSTEA